MLINKEITKEKKWILSYDYSPSAENAVAEISRSLKVNSILARLLYNRGYTNVKDASSFLKMENEMLRNPFDMKDVDKGVARIKAAIDKGERITVYGDYDVDGVTSVCTLYLYLKEQGADIDYYIPNRSGEGYGVSERAIDMLKEKGTTLIVTVDTGVTANKEVEYAKSIGVDFVITDHHECHADLPPAEAVINPHRPDCPYPFKELAGVGVVFKLISAYEERINTPDRLTATLKVIKGYADLVAIGTIADVMPIKEENRIIVKYGLGMIENTERPGLSALIDAATNKSDNTRRDPKTKVVKKKKKTKITSGFIGFTLAPRINAAGRVRSAALAVELFLSESYSSAKDIAEELCEANKERQAEENKIMQEAYEKIESLGIDKDPVIVLDADTWHHGVIGIVSSRITEKYCRPSILVSFEGNGEIPTPDDVGKGSGRSVKGLNLVEALCHVQDHLVKFGGHELAAGLSVTRSELPIFREKINEYAREAFSDKDLVPIVEADMEIDSSDVTLEIAESLRLLEPYGVDNPIPVFVMREVPVVEINGVSEGKHSRLTLATERGNVSAMFFSNSPEALGVHNGDTVDILFSIDINEWLDRKNVQLIIRDLKIKEEKSLQEKRERDRFEAIKGGAPIGSDEDVVPTREDFVEVYKLIQGSIHLGQDSFTHAELISRIKSSVKSVKIGYIKLKFIIMIFREMNIIGIDEVENESYRFKIQYSTTKKNLEKSHILRKLRSQRV